MGLGEIPGKADKGECVQEERDETEDNTMRTGRSSTNTHTNRGCGKLGPRTHLGAPPPKLHLGTDQPQQ